MESIQIEIDRDKIKKIINDRIQAVVESQLDSSMDDIKKSIKQYFYKGFINQGTNEFERALDYTVEAAFRDAVKKAMDDLNFTELIAEKSKELLQKDDYIQRLADQKVRASLGLPQKESE